MYRDLSMCLYVYMYATGWKKLTVEWLKSVFKYSSSVKLIKAS